MADTEVGPPEDAYRFAIGFIWRVHLRADRMNSVGEKWPDPPTQPSREDQGERRDKCRGASGRKERGSGVEGKKGQGGRSEVSG
jgi:hypothetical protein